MSRRPIHVAFCLLACVGSLAQAQGCDYSRRLADASSIQVTRDPAALKILQSALASLGGQQAWSTVATMRITAATAATAKKPATQVTSTEIFSLPTGPRSTRVIVNGSSTTTLVADENLKPAAAKIGAAAINVPPTSPLELIATENPGIVIAYALGKANISACVLQNTTEIAV